MANPFKVWKEQTEWGTYEYMYLQVAVPPLVNLYLWFRIQSDIDRIRMSGQIGPGFMIFQYRIQKKKDSDPDPGSKPLCHENFTSSLDDFQYVLPFNFPFLDFSVIIFLVNNFWRTFYKLMRLGSGSGIGHWHLTPDPDPAKFENRIRIQRN